jgi:hypothetical protein
MKMPAFQHRQLVGHDILLARHGSHICSMRVDRHAGRVVALLDDGSTDSAPNLIAPGLRMPPTIRSVLRQDWKFFAVVTACSTGSAGALFAAALAVSGDPEVAALLTGYTGS